ncbi:MAG: MFS transporter [Pseudomonas sp.]|uniref:MFS transporter n=1 Tax=Pseudomonas abieticivorans TaxID=2931382 RepID=UPI0020BF9743|nr:MFS transporter [Pseudomonas sp. PIA16]MDE1164764.1 MFS transporter [Pseudomonas sp.]
MAQIIAWGGSFYLIAVLAAPVVQDTGWSQAWVYGSLSLAILISGLLAPRVGHLVARIGGRTLLLASAPTLALGLVLLSIAPSLPMFVASWVVIGLGMAAGLYDVLFATLGKLFGKNARSAITQVTLVSGFCTSITWPLVATLVAHLGWRGACLAYALLLMGVVLPIYWRCVPRHEPVTAAKAAAQPAQALPQGKVFWLLTASFTLAAVIFTAISVQLISLLQAQGLSLVAALGIAALIGPSQVAARVVEVLFGRQAHPIWSALGSVLMVAAGLLCIHFASGLAVLGIIVYGVGSGIRSIVRGTLPLALFGPAVYAVVLGRIARPTLIAQALTPIVGGYLQAHFGAGVTLGVLAGLAVVNVLLVGLLIKSIRAPLAVSAHRGSP